MADFFATSIDGDAMQLGDDGRYFEIIRATRHGMGANAYVSRAVYKDPESSSLDNVLYAYETLTGGDIKIYTDIPVSLRLTICRGNPVTATLFGEDDDYADA